jgi:hypothetical protein
MGNELFSDITEDAWNVANAIELFHNFTLIHDDIMDKRPCGEVCKLCMKNTATVRPCWQAM